MQSTGLWIDDVGPCRCQPSQSLIGRVDPLLDSRSTTCRLGGFARLGKLPLCDAVQPATHKDLNRIVDLRYR